MKLRDKIIDRMTNKGYKDIDIVKKSVVEVKGVYRPGYTIFFNSPLDGDLGFNCWKAECLGDRINCHSLTAAYDSLEHLPSLHTYDD